MLARGHGRIVNVSSSAGLAAIPMLSAYAVSKTALYRFSENLAAETRGHGVMVFAINPGLVRTAMSESALSCGEPSIEQWFTDAFAGQRDVSTESAATGHLPRLRSSRRPVRPQYLRNQGRDTDGGPGRRDRRA